MRRLRKAGQAPPFMLARGKTAPMRSGNRTGTPPRRAPGRLRHCGPCRDEDARAGGNRLPKKVAAMPDFVALQLA
jgi:hypothetical protein